MENQFLLTRAKVWWNHDIFTWLITNHQVLRFQLVALHEQAKKPIGPQIAQLKAPFSVSGRLRQDFAKLNRLNGANQEVDSVDPGCLLVNLLAGSGSTS